MSPVILRAKVVVPVSGDPIENGAILVAGERIRAVGPWPEVKAFESSRVLDLGDAAVIPGLINAHCHLDYTDMAGMIPPPKDFPSWIKSILAVKGSWGYSDYAFSWLRGARMLLNYGVTTVADIEAVPELLPEAKSATPLKVLSFLEMTGIRSGRNPEDVVREGVATVASWSADGIGGLSPHAPYSTMPALLTLSAEAARKRGWLVATHVGESEAEFEMYLSRRGPLFEWLKNQRAMDDCGGVSPVEHLRRHGLIRKNLLAIHANYLRTGDAEMLGRSEATVVHCPRSHLYFKHNPFPRRELAAANVNICLGTDSLASVYRKRRETVELNMFHEMQALANAHPDLPACEILKMATINGAKALGREGQIGQLSPGACADLAVLPFSGRKRGLYEAIIGHRGTVDGLMINGRWIVRPSAVG